VPPHGIIGISPRNHPTDSKGGPSRSRHPSACGRWRTRRDCRRRSRWREIAGAPDRRLRSGRFSGSLSPNLAPHASRPLCSLARRIFLPAFHADDRPASPAVALTRIRQLLAADHARIRGIPFGSDLSPKENPHAGAGQDGDGEKNEDSVIPVVARGAASIIALPAWRLGLRGRYRRYRCPRNVGNGWRMDGSRPAASHGSADRAACRARDGRQLEAWGFTADPQAFRRPHRAAAAIYGPGERAARRAGRERSRRQGRPYFRVPHYPPERSGASGKLHPGTWAPGPRARRRLTWPLLPPVVALAPNKIVSPSVLAGTHRNARSNKNHEAGLRRLRNGTGVAG